LERAEDRGATTSLDAQVKEYDARIAQGRNHSELLLKEAEININSFLGNLQLQIEVAKAGANVSSQLAASALSMVNVTARLGHDTEHTQRTSIQHSTSIRNSAMYQDSYSATENITH